MRKRGNGDRDDGRGPRVRRPGVSGSALRLRVARGGALSGRGAPVALPLQGDEVGGVDEAVDECGGARPIHWGRGQSTPKLLSTAPGVGPVVSTAFVATLDEAQRFNGAHQVESFLALVPSEKSSGEKQHRGAITRAGSRRMHGLLVQSAWTLLRSRSTKTAKLRDWAAKIALRRGKNVAGGGVARRLAGILFAMWRDGTPFCGGRSPPPASAPTPSAAAPPAPRRPTASWCRPPACPSGGATALSEHTGPGGLHASLPAFCFRTVESFCCPEDTP